MNRRPRSASALVVACFVCATCPSARAADEPAPATLAEIRDAVDWEKLPRLPEAQDVRHRLASSTYKAPGSFADAAAFFRKALPGVGWVEDATPIPGVDQKDYLYVAFDKGPMRLSINGYRTEPAGPMTVTLTLSGNVDVRKFPKPADAKVRTDQRTATMYTTAAKPEDAAEFCRKAILERGGREVPADSAKFHAKEGRIVLRFLKNAMEVGVVASKEQDGATQVTCHTSVRHDFEPADVRSALTAKDIPTPPTLKEYLAVLDLRKVPLMENAGKRDRQTGPIAVSTGVTCQVPTTLDKAVGYYRKELTERGWKETAADAEIPGRVQLFFEKDGYLVTAEFSQRGGKKEVELTVTNHGNVDVRQLPYPAGAEIGAERNTFVNATTTLSESDAVEFYRKELGKLGWKEIKDIPGRGNYAFIQHATELRLEVGTDVEGRTSLQLRPILLAIE